LWARATAPFFEPALRAGVLGAVVFDALFEDRFAALFEDVVPRVPTAIRQPSS
jgi:hypothetical protein